MGICNSLCNFGLLQDFQNYTVARDSFLAHLGATLWGSMRHIISPSVSDGAYHFYEKISFQLYFITQEVYHSLISSFWCLRMLFGTVNMVKLVPSFTVVLLFQKVRHAKQLPVQLKPLKEGLSSLLVPPQKVVFSQHMYVLWLLCQHLFCALLFSI